MIKVFKVFPVGKGVGFFLEVALLSLVFIMASVFFIFKKVSFFDDSFIYLHMATNIVELGTARYFPVADSGLLLASSPLRLLTLVPTFLVFDFFEIPLRTMDAARSAFLFSGVFAFLIFIPFWRDKLNYYLLLAIFVFLLGCSFDSVLLMEGALVVCSTATLFKFFWERSQSFILLGLVVFLVGLSRPEIGFVAVICTSFYVLSVGKGHIVKFFAGILLSFSVYVVVMISLGVYPIPSSIWSKQVTSAEALFGSISVLEGLPEKIGSLVFGLQSDFYAEISGWVVIFLPLMLSVFNLRLFVFVLSGVGLLCGLAGAMSANFLWYFDNFILILFLILLGVSFELWRNNKIIPAALGFVVVCGMIFSSISVGYGVSRSYPWNDGSRLFNAYRQVGGGALSDGFYKIEPYSDEPVRIRMCEIGIPAFFSGNQSWIYDLCGLAQVGNLKSSGESWLKYFYPESFLESGEHQLSRLPGSKNYKVIDVWGLRSEAEVSRAKDNCQYSDQFFCINSYK